MNVFPGFWLGKWQEELVWGEGCAAVILKIPKGCRWTPSAHSVEAEGFKMLLLGPGYYHVSQLYRFVGFSLPSF